MSKKNRIVLDFGITSSENIGNADEWWWGVQDWWVNELTIGDTK